MDPLNQVQIQKIAEITAPGPNNQPATYLQATFNVGQHGPFTLRFLKDSFNPMEAKQQIATFAQGLATLQS